MSANKTYPVSVSISPSENPVCQGAQVTFTAIPVNGGITPTSYQWTVGTTIQGTGNPFTYNNFYDGAIVTCKLTSSLTCPYGNPATSNPDTMHVMPTLPASISITASSNPFCTGSTVRFSSSITNGGISPVYQWKVGGSNVGSNHDTLNYTPANGDVITCTLTSNSTCISGSNTVTSNAITMTSTTSLPASVSITASANPVCQNTAVTFYATPVNGGFTPAYQWKIGSTNFGLNNPIFTCTPTNGNVITCVLTSSLSCATGSPATSNAINMTVNNPVPVSVTISPLTPYVCLGTQLTFTATPVNGGTSPYYIWRVNGIKIQPSNNGPTFTYTPANGDIVTCELISNATCITGNPAISNQVVVSVGSELPVSVTITAQTNPFCPGSSIKFKAHPVNGGDTAKFEWWRHHNGNTLLSSGNWDSVYTYNSPVGFDTITCKLTSNAGCICNNPATSDSIILVVSTGQPVGVSITVNLNPICPGTLVNFTATPVNGGSSPTYQWKVNGTNVGQNGLAYSYTPVNGDCITCVLTSSLSCATGNPATSNLICMNVLPPAPVSITISASPNPCCAGSSVTFTADTVNGGSNPQFQWLDNGTNVGTNSPTYICTPANNHVFQCWVMSNAMCRTGNPAYSNLITMIVNPYLTPTVSITASQNPVCQGGSVTFTATPVNGGSSPSYQWKVNGTNSGANSPTFTYTPVNGDVVSCIMTSNEQCLLLGTATSNSVLMTVSPYTPVSISITTALNPVCQGQSATFSATPVNGGPLPSYQWKVNSINYGAPTNNNLFTYPPNNGDIVTCVMTSNTSCPTGNPATSNPVIMNVSSSLPVSDSITASSNPACQGQLITFTSYPVNGGLHPYYQWLVRGVPVGAHDSVFSYIPSTGDTVCCQVTSNLTCTTGNPAMSKCIAIAFSPFLPVSVTITCSQNPACLGNPVNFTAYPANGGTSPSYQWKLNGTNVGLNSPNYSYTPASGNVISCELTSNIHCPINNPGVSNSITMMVQNPVPVSVSISSSANPVCTGTYVTFTATPINGGSSPSYLWKVNGTNAGTNSNTFTYQPGNGDVVTCYLTSSLSCVSGSPAVSNAVNMSVSNSFPVSVTISASANPVCQGQAVTLTAIPVNGGPNPVFQWKVKGLNVGGNFPAYSYIPSNNDCITCTLTSSYSCATGNPVVSTPVCMTVNAYVPASVSVSCSMKPACTGTPITFTATPSNGGTAPSYQWKVNGTGAGPDSPVYTYTPVNGEIVTCLMTSSLQCVSGSPAVSNQVTMTIGSSFPVNISITGPSLICQYTGVTFWATPVYPGSIPDYQWFISDSLIDDHDSVAYTCLPFQGSVIKCVMTSNLPCGTNNPATSNLITMTVLPSP